MGSITRDRGLNGQTVRIVSTDPVTDHVAHLRLRNLSVTSCQQRRYALDRVARYLGASHSDLLAVLPSDLDTWQHDIARLSPRYRNSQIAHLIGFYRWCEEQRLVGESPCGVLLRPRLPRAIPHPIGEDDLAMAIACAPDRIRLMLVLAAYAGLRAGEIARLDRWNILETATPPVIVVSGKGGRERVVPMSSRVLLELRSHGLPQRGPIFPRYDGRGGANTPARISRLCGQYLHDMAIGESLHSLRHRFATATYQRTRDLRTVQELLGHASPTTTAGYAAYSSTAAVIAVEAICTAAVPDPFPAAS